MTARSSKGDSHRQWVVYIAFIKNFKSKSCGGMLENQSSVIAEDFLQYSPTVFGGKTTGPDQASTEINLLIAK